MCSCQGVTAGSLCPLSQRGCDCWSVTSLSPACLPYTTPPPSPPHSCTPTAWPALLLCLWPSLSLDPHCIWVWSAMETCSAQLEAAASWASPPSFHPSSLVLPHPPSVPLQWLHAPASHNHSLSHAHNHAKLMGTLSLACGWKRRFVTRLHSVDAMHAHPCHCVETYQDRQTHTCTR